MTDGGKEEADDDELTNNEHSSVAYDPGRTIGKFLIRGWEGRGG